MSSPLPHSCRHCRLGVWIALSCVVAEIAFTGTNAVHIPMDYPAVLDDRGVHLQALAKIALPVLKHTAECTLHSAMINQTEPHQSTGINCTSYRLAAAFGRTLAGIGPWLELGAGQIPRTPEDELRAEFLNLTKRAFYNVFMNTSCGDYVHWNQCVSVLVEAAYIGHTMLRMPSIIQALPPEWLAAIRDQMYVALSVPNLVRNNHANFPAMVQAGLWRHNLSAATNFIHSAMEDQENWYVGDGTYSDGAFVHFDHYNSFVMHSMVVDITAECRRQGNPLGERYPCLLKRMQRWAEINERMIHTDGSYLVVGRSQHYRFGAFQVLSQLALQHNLPPSLPPGKVRHGLTAVISRFLSNPDNFIDGWLSAGVNGHQPSMMNPYGDTGALYLVSLGLLQLGLPATDPFWTDPTISCTQAQIWTEGKDIGLDEAYDGPACAIT